VATIVVLVGIFYRDLLFRGLILGDYDAFVYFYPLREYAAEALRQGRFPLWIPELFLGAPFFANVQTAVLYPPNLLFLVMPVPYAYSASVALHLVLAGVGSFLFARRCLGVGRLPSLLTAMTFMFSGFMSGQIGHINQLTVAAWMPVLLVVFDEAARRRSLPLAIATGLIGSLQLLAGHTQEWYFSTVVLAIFALWRVAASPVWLKSTLGSGLVARPRDWLPVGWRSKLIPLAILGVAAVVEIGTTAVQVLPSMELSAESIRGGGMNYGEATSFSLPPTTALFTVLPAYPENLFSEYVGYVGVVPLVRAALAVVAWAARPITLLMVGLAGLGLFMALGKFNPFYPVLFHWMPGLDLFRVPARWLLVYTFGMAALAGLGAQTLLDLGERVPRPRRPGRVQKAVSISRLLAGALLLGGGLGLLAVFYRLATPAPSQEQLVTWNVLTGAALALIGLGGLGRRVRWISLGLLLAMAGGELWVAGEMTSARHPIPYEAYRPDRSSTSFLLADAARRDSPGRLLSFATDQYEVKETPDYKRQYEGSIHPDALIQFMVDIKLSEVLAANIPAEYGIETVDGYDGGILPLKRYGELRSLLLPGLDIPPDVPLRTNLIGAPPLRLLDLLNVRYLLGSKIQDTTIDGVYYDRGVSIVLNPGATERLERIPAVTTDSIGLISSTEGARERKDGEIAANLVVTDLSGVSVTVPLRFGTETGETPERDAVSKPPAHRKPRLVEPWNPKLPATEYYARVPLPVPMQVRSLAIQNPLHEAKVRIRAISLIDGKWGTSPPLVLSDRLDRQLFFDMPLYTNRTPLPRAFAATISVVRGDESALGLVSQPQLDLSRTAVLAPSPSARVLFQTGTPDSGRAARIVSYQPERVVVEVDDGQPGYLMLLDAFYPGWRATVDGVEVPVERADYFFRAVYVASGPHTVVFSYMPESFLLGLRITATSLALIVAVLLLWVVRLRPGRRRPVV